MSWSLFGATRHLLQSKRERRETERQRDRETEREIDKKRMTKKEIKILGGHIDHIDIQG